MLTPPNDGNLLTGSPPNLPPGQPEAHHVTSPQWEQMEHGAQQKKWKWWNAVNDTPPIVMDMNSEFGLSKYCVVGVDVSFSGFKVCFMSVPFKGCVWLESSSESTEWHIASESVKNNVLKSQYR